MNMHLPHPAQLRRAVHCLKRGGIIAYPTEGVFGVGCNPRNPAALNRLLTLKQRDWRKGLILIAADFEQVENFLLPLSSQFKRKVLEGWPGPVTWLLPARPEVSPLLRGTHASLAVRVTAHPGSAALCRAWGGALVSTSANPSTRPAARSALHVHRYFGTAVDYVVPGRLGGLAGPTEIRDGRDNRVLRAASS